jgi:ring-1,2-phenylacetyl-CoA epoxidase subunit PaaC
MVAQGVAPAFEPLRADFLAHEAEVLDEETQENPPVNSNVQRGGKQGRHTERLGYILAEMQFLQRAYPGVEW